MHDMKNTWKFQCRYANGVVVLTVPKVIFCSEEFCFWRFDRWRA